jgi:hypothetical protein
MKGDAMKRAIIAIMGILLVFAGTEAMGAKKGKKKKGKGKEPKEVTVAPKSDQIAPMIEEFKWGMTKDEVIKILSKKIQGEYQEKMAKAADPIKEDKLHQTMLQKIKALKDSYVEFKGQVTGFDSSLVKTEYTHKNGESMIIFPKDLKTERKWDDYFFFINEKLWKMFRAFDADMFPGLTWNDVAAAMGTKFGEGPLKVKKYDSDTKIVHILGLQWQDDNTLLTLLNYTTFYGIFCLRFEDKQMLKQIDSLRVNKPPVETTESIVDAITEGTAQDASHDIVDQLTKKKPKGSGTSGSTGSTGSKGTKKSKGSGTDNLPPPKKEKESELDDLGI